MTTTAPALCGYGQPIEPGADRCCSCEFAGPGPAPCRFPRQDIRDQGQDGPPHPADDPREQARHLPRIPGDQASRPARRAHLRPVDDHQDQDQDQDRDDEVVLEAIPLYPVDELRGPLHDFVSWAVRDGLPAAAAGAAGLAALATVAGHAELRLTSTVTIRPALWVVPVGGTGTGKSPALIQAFTEIERLYSAEREQWDEQQQTGEGEGIPRPESLVSKDVTLPSVARWLKDNGGAGTLLYDELEALLAELGGKDRAKLSEAWTARTSWHIQRVGDGGNRNAIDIYVPHPVLSVFGPLTPENTLLLGREGNGFRARWLPHLVNERAEMLSAGSHPETWTAVIGALYGNREARQWRLEGAARLLFEKASQRWKAEQDEPYPQSVIEALRKAGIQCARVALVIAESLDPGTAGMAGNIPVRAVESAIALTDYAMGCWKAMPGGSVLTLSMTDEKLTQATDELLAWLETRSKGTEGLPEGDEPRPRASRREIQQAKVAGAVKPRLLNALLMEYAERFPGCVVDVPQTGGKGGGRPRMFVYFPRRHGGIGVDATSIRPAPSGDDSNELPGQSDADPPRIGVESFNTDRVNTDPSTPIRRPGPEPDGPANAAGGASAALHSVRCPSCHWRFKTAVQPGEQAWCKQCSHQFMVSGKGDDGQL
ncbi:MAG TPA: DUF3987 domain-containing protein [Streptosporangiaceae bacterium]